MNSNQIGDPYILAELDVTPRETFCLTKSIKGMAYCNADYWLKGGRKYLKKPDRIEYVRPSNRKTTGGPIQPTTGISILDFL